LEATASPKRISTSRPNARIGSSAEVAAVQSPKYAKDISVKLEDIVHVSKESLGTLPNPSPPEFPKESLPSPISSPASNSSSGTRTPRKRSSNKARVAQPSNPSNATNSELVGVENPNVKAITTNYVSTSTIFASPPLSTPNVARKLSIGTPSSSQLDIETSPSSTSPTNNEAQQRLNPTSTKTLHTKRASLYEGNGHNGNNQDPEQWASLEGPSTCVGRHIARRLVEIGVTDIFTVPGDFNLILLDHLIAEPSLKNIGCCNEINAGYAADGYARCRGVGACVVTFTVGGLSVINAIAGSYSENLPIICLVGGPNSNDFGTNRILHHTIGIPDFSQEFICFEQVTCFQAIQTFNTS
jgi:hypothetical protein